MNASAAVPGWLGPTRAGYSFRRIEAGENAKPMCDWGARVDGLRNILGRDGHTITQLSAATRRRYGSRSPYFIPPSFLYRLRSGVTPHVCQIVALSESTGYRFVDWLRIFGFDLHQIPRLQIRLHPERTTLVTPMEDCFEPFLPRPSLGYERSRSSVLWPGPGEWNGRAPLPVRQDWEHRCCWLSEASPGNILRVDRYYTQRVHGLDPVSMVALMAGRAPLWTGLQPGEMD